jgi:hypothetical protein
MTVLLHAAGSLRDALTDIAEAFAASGITVQAKYGPSGTLRDEIAAGAAAELRPRTRCAGPNSRMAPWSAFTRVCDALWRKPGTGLVVSTPAFAVAQAGLRRCSVRRKARGL